MLHSTRKKRGRLLVASIMVLVIVTSGIVVAVRYPHPPASPPPVGLTFEEVAASAGDAVRNATGAPWNLASALGVLSSKPVWLDPLGDEYCRSWAGVSVWNASRIPLASGQFSSGVVPFWSLIYKNSSQYLVDAVSENRSVHLVGPVPPTSSCGEFMDLVLGNLSTVPSVDSPAASAYAWNLVGGSYVAAYPSAVEFYEIGGGQLPAVGSTNGGWIVGYQVCGLEGYAGLDPVPAVTLKFQNTTGAYYLDRSSGGCSQGGFEVRYGTPTNSSGPGFSTVMALPLSLGFTNSNNTTDGWGLTSWMTRISIVNASDGQSYPPGPLACSATNLSSASCGSVPSWYAVLTSPTGYWLDAYGNISGVPGWLLPNVPFYTGDSLLFVHSALFGSAAYTLSITSVTSAVQISGTATV